MTERNHSPSPSSHSALSENSAANFNFNRLALTSEFKNQICAQITDSAESLPLWARNQSREGASTGSLTSTVPSDNDDDDMVASAAATTNQQPQQQQQQQQQQDDDFEGSVPDTSDQQTPKPRDTNPLSPVGSRQLEHAGTTDTLRNVASSATVVGPKAKRPNALRRLTTKLRKTVSSATDEKS